MTKKVAVFGPNTESCSQEIYDFGVKLGEVLATNDYVVICGGKAGFMEAICRGARGVEGSKRGVTIGLVPGDDESDANPYCDIVIPTRLELMRNALIASSAQSIIAFGGGAGTLSEIALAWQFGKRVYCCVGFGGWSEELAERQLDNRRSQLLVPFKSLDELISLLQDER